MITHRLSRRLYASAAIALAIVLFMALNIVSTVWLRAMRIDLTENGLYTLSDGTRATLAKLKEPITLRFFYSREVAAGYSQVRAYADEVRDLLQEYAAYAPGMIRLEEIDPAPYTPEEDRPRRWALRRADAGRRPGILRSCRHQHGQRPRDHSVLLAGPRGIPRIRYFLGDLSPGQPDAAAAGRAVHHSARGRIRRPDGGVAGAIAALRHLFAAGADLRSEKCGRHRRPHSAGSENVVGRSSGRPATPHALRHRPVRHARRQGHRDRRSAVRDSWARNRKAWAAIARP